MCTYTHVRACVCVSLRLVCMDMKVLIKKKEKISFTNKRKKFHRLYHSLKLNSLGVKNTYTIKI